jgi:hypothetical protein
MWAFIISLAAIAVVWSLVEKLILRSRLLPTKGKIIGFNECIDWAAFDDEGDSDRYYYIPLVTYEVGDQNYVSMPRYKDPYRIFDVRKPVDLLYDPTNPEKIYLNIFFLGARKISTVRHDHYEIIGEAMQKYILRQGFKNLTLDYTRKEIPGYNKAVIDIFITGMIGSENASRLLSLIKTERALLPKLTDELKEFSKRHSISFVNKLETDGYKYFDWKLVRFVKPENLKEFSGNSLKVIVQHYFKTGNK